MSDEDEKIRRIKQEYLDQLAGEDFDEEEEAEADFSDEDEGDTTVKKESIKEEGGEEEDEEDEEGVPNAEDVAFIAADDEVEDVGPIRRSMRKKRTGMGTTDDSLPKRKRIRRNVEESDESADENKETTMDPFALLAQAQHSHAHPHAHAPQSNFDEDELADFIVDNDDNPIQPQAHGRDLLSDIFGDVSEYLPQYVREQTPRADTYEEREEMLSKTFEPSVLEEMQLTKEDETIRAIDIPERLQTRFTTANIVKIDDYESEVRWILLKHKNLSGNAIQIENALKLVNEEYFEPPYINLYCKEAISPLNLEKIWMIYDADTEYRKLIARKLRLMRLIESKGFKCGPLKAFSENPFSFEFENLIDDEKELTQEKIEERITMLLNNAIDETALNDARDYFLLQSAKKDALAKMKNEDEEMDFAVSGFDDENGKEKKAKQNMTRSLSKYVSAVKEKLITDFSSKFLISPEEFGKNWQILDSGSSMKSFRAPNDPIDLPSDLASHYIARVFPAIENVLRTTIECQAFAISSEPSVRDKARKVYFETVKMSTEPTPLKGMQLSCFHPFFPVKRIVGLPLTSSVFNAFQKKSIFLKIFQAEKQHFINVKFFLSEFAFDDITEKLSKCYINEDALEPSGNENSIFHNWNQIRREIIDKALRQFLFPLFERELRENLLMKCGNAVLAKSCRKMTAKLSLSPYSFLTSTDNQKRTILSIHISTVTTSLTSVGTACVAVIGECGQVIETIPLPFLLVRLERNPETKRLLNNQANVHNQQRKRNNWDTLFRLLDDYEPEVIVLASASMMAIKFHDEVRDILQNPRFEGKYKSIRVEYVDPSFSAIYATNEKGIKEFPTLIPDMRMAISCGRFFLDPLLELCYLCLTRDDVNSIACTLQGSLSHYCAFRPDESAEKLHRCFIDLCSHVGTDANNPRLFHSSISSHSSIILRSSAVATFIPGLGLRKARALMESIAKREVITSRKALAKLLTPKVSQNCLGFIRIEADDHDYLYLDSMRIPPHLYWLSAFVLEQLTGTKLKATQWNKTNTYQYYGGDDEDDGEDEKGGNELIALSRALERFMRDQDRPDKEKRKTKPLTALRLEEIKETVQRERGMNVPFLLNLIVMEFASPFGDKERKRKGRDALRDQENRSKESGSLFYMITGESKKTFLRSISTFVVTSVLPSRSGSGFLILGRLGSGVLASGFIENETGNIPQVGETIPCKIMDVNYDTLKVKVDFDESKVTGEGMVESELQYIANIENVFRVTSSHSDHYYVDFSKEKDELLHPMKSEKQLIFRHITHKNFKNDWPGNIMEAMNDKSVPIGEIIFFPGTEPNQLRALWKMYEGVFRTFVIDEPKKDGGHLLGSVLEIDKETYDDLDEIIFRMIEPMNKLVRSLEACLKFKFLGREDIEELLKQEKAANPSHNPYYFGFSLRHSGAIELSYLPSMKTIRRQYIRITPHGFQFFANKQVFRTIDKLIAWFKQNYAQLEQDPKHTSHTSSHSQSQSQSQSHSHSHSRSTTHRTDSYSSSRQGYQPRFRK